LKRAHALSAVGGKHLKAEHVARRVATERRLPQKKEGVVDATMENVQSAEKTLKKRTKRKSTQNVRSAERGIRKQAKDGMRRARSSSDKRYGCGKREA
jgi:hypothetical protein